MNEFAELCEDLVLSFRSLLVVELGESAFLVSAVDLVLLAKTHGLHTTMSGENIIKFNKFIYTPHFLRRFRGVYSVKKIMLK